MLRMHFKWYNSCIHNDRRDLPRYCITLQSWVSEASFWYSLRYVLSSSWGFSYTYTHTLINTVWYYWQTTLFLQVNIHDGFRGYDYEFECNFWIPSDMTDCYKSFSNTGIHMHLSTTYSVSPEISEGYHGLVWSYWRRKFLVFPCPKLGRLRTNPGTILHGQF